MTRFKQFIFNGLLITAVSLIMRTVSVSFNVYISNRIGAVAMGVFTLISTVYGFAVTVATSGIGLASTRLIAEALGQENADVTPFRKSRSVSCIVRKCVIYALCFSIAAALILFFFSEMIGIHLLADERTVLPLRILAFTLPPIALSSVFSGYFVAVRRVYKNAIVQIVGQGTRIFSCIFFIAVLTADDVESACLAIVGGGAVSELLSFLVQYILYLTEKRKKASKKPTSVEEKKIQKDVIHTALPMAFSAYVRSGLITIEHMLIPWGLERSGSSRDTALAAYGTVHSMVFPLVLFPSALSGSFAGLLIPEIAESQAIGDKERIERIIGKVLQCVLIFAIGTVGIMMCFSYELADMVYPGVGAGKYILMISPLIPVMYLDTSIDGILKGMGEQVYCMGVNIIDSLLSVILVWLLLPTLGIQGYIITVYFTEIVNATLSITRLLMITKAKLHLFNRLVKPLVAIVAATALVRWILSRFSVIILSPWQLTAHILLTLSIYFGLLILTKAIRVNQ